MKLEGKSLLIFGSRTLDDQRVELEIDKFVTGTDYHILITAHDPRGVCARVKHYVQTFQRGFILLQVGLDKRRARGMHEARSIAALQMADHLLAIWDGTSKGTAGEIKLAKKMNVPTTIVQLVARDKAWPDIDLTQLAEVFA